MPQLNLAPQTPDRLELPRLRPRNSKKPGGPHRTERETNRYEPYPGPSKAKREALQQKLAETREFCQEMLNPFN